MAGTGSDAVAIVSHETAKGTAGEVMLVLHERGLAAFVASTTAEAREAAAVVVVLTQALCQDPETIAMLAPLRGNRLVPVRAEAVLDSEVPQFLSELNWILWDTATPAAKAASLITAIHTDVGRYREGRSLEAIAAAWEASRWDPDFLMADRHAVRTALSRSTAVAGEVLLTPSTRLLAFLRASDKATQRMWWKRNRTWAFRLAVLTGVVIIAVTGWQTVAEQRAANLLAVVLLEQSGGNRGDISALKLAGLIDQQTSAGRAVPDTAAGRLMDNLARPWDLGFLGAAFPLNMFSFVGEGHTVIVADGQSGLSSMSTRDGSVDWRRSTGNSPAIAMAATPDGRRVVLADTANVMRNIDTATWQMQSEEVAGSVVQVAAPTISPNIAVAALADGSLVSVTFGADGGVREVGRFDDVLDLKASSAGDTRALVRAGSSLAIVDALSGQVLSERDWEPVEFESGALSPSGDAVAITGPGEQLWFGAGDLDFMPTGQAVPDIVGAIAITPTGAIAFASNAFGATLLDPRTETLTRVCTSVDLIDGIVISDDGSRLLCASRGTAILSSLDHLIADPVAPRMGVAGSGRTAFSNGPIRRAEINERSVVIAQVGDETLNLDPTAFTVGNVVFGPQSETDEIPWIPGSILGGGEPTTIVVATDGTSMAVGTSMGVVTVLDVNDDGLLALASRWTSPDRQPISVIGFTEDGQSLAIRTAEDRWWSAPSCLGCGRDTGQLLDAVARRLWFCYPEKTLELLQEGTRRRLDTRSCPTIPEKDG